MKLNLFRIKNYKSIIDSGDCYLSGDNVTILAGRNEAGKTNILEALEDFNIDKDIRPEAIPVHKKETEPEIEINFNLNKNEVNTFFERLGINLNKKEELSIKLIKKYPNEYLFSNETKNELDPTIKKNMKKTLLKIKSTYKEIEKLATKDFATITAPLFEFPDLDTENLGELKNEIKDLWNRTQNDTKLIKTESKGEIYIELVEEIYQATQLLKDNPLDEFLVILKQEIPHFIFFSSFEDIFPSEIAIDEAEKNDLIQDLCVVSDLNIKTIREGTITEKIGHKKKLNTKLKKDYEEFWSQDFANLTVDWDSNNLYFLFEEDEKFYPPKIRSKGKQWHLAFYIRLTARSKEEKDNVILIDEPGLFLHAKAQEDVLKKIEHASKETAIVFSTHSPYLIENDKLHRIRLVSKDNLEGTKISNKIHKDADKESLTPIITAIGLDLSKGLNIAKKNNIIVEGISDYYYLSALQLILKYDFKENTHIIPCVGADKIHTILPLIMGWGLNYCILLDNDKKGKNVKKDLIKNYKDDTLNIVLVSENEEEEVEDLFTKTNFAKWVLEENESDISNKKNSEIVKDGNYDKVLLSKLFYEKAKNDKIKLSNESKQKFKKLFDKINELLFKNI